MSGRNGRMAIFSCVYLLDAESVFVVFVVPLGRYLCRGVIYIIYYLLIRFVYWNLQKNRNSEQASLLSYSYSGTNYFDVCFSKHFLFTHFVLSCDIIVTLHILKKNMYKNKM